MNRRIMALLIGCVSILAPLQAGAASKSALTADIKIGTGIENHEVVGAADSFPANTPQLVGWTQITGATEPAQIMHIWKLNGKEVSSVPLKAAFSPYRTYSRKTVDGSGTYTLEVKDVDGKVIASKDVEVKAP